MSVSTTAALAEFVTDLRYEAVPAAVVEIVQRQVLDTIGVALAGVDQEATRIAREVVVANGSREAATVWGTDLLASELDASLLNGTAAHALDFDDMWLPGSHPSAAILPAALAVAESRHAPGRDLLAALTAGYEIMGRLHSVVNGRSGWHPTSVFGTFGAAAACSRLMGLTAAQTASAFGIASSLCSGIDAHEGTMAKPLHAGTAARSGALAAQLAAGGLTASMEIFESPHSFFDAFFTGERVALWRLTAGLGAGFHLLSPGIGIKMYPTGYYTQHAFEATLHIVTEYDLTAADIAEVRIGVRPETRFNRSTPASALDAKFSLQYVAAVAILDRALTRDSFAPDKVGSPAVQEMLARITLYHDSRLSTNRDLFSNPVTIRCADGREFTHSVAKPRSHWAYDLPRAAWVGKFLDNAIPILGESAANDVIAMIDKLMDSSDVAQIARRLRVPGPQSDPPSRRTT